MKRLSYLPSWKGIWAYLLDKHSAKLPKIFLILALLYLVFPFDFIPDLAAIVGWLDDLGLNLLALWYVLKTANDYELKSEGKKKVDYERRNG